MSKKELAELEKISCEIAEMVDLFLMTNIEILLKNKCENLSDEKMRKFSHSLYITALVTLLSGECRPLYRSQEKLESIKSFLINNLTIAKTERE